MHRTIVNREHKFIALFISLILMILVSPLFLTRSYGELTISGLSLIIIITSIYSIRENKKHFLYLTVIAMVIFLVTLLKVNHFNMKYELIDLILSFSFYCTVAIMIITIVLEEREITRDLIFGALSAYLLIGIAYGNLYELIEFIFPGSFLYSGNQGFGLVRNYDLVYFSFTTLSTVGFGDVIAINSYARSIVILEEVTGIFYLAVLVARLVGSMAYRDKNRTKL